jgi:hypothetical protein
MIGVVIIYGLLMIGYVVSSFLLDKKIHEGRDKRI